ncbi:hypothetical protein HDU76_013724 [Blyttiomyces sp. JEL0837]|nr:hypothetical protein HDU76_013724 [Blyttiomyces sp. JEL0837]
MWHRPFDNYIEAPTASSSVNNNGSSSNGSDNTVAIAAGSAVGAILLIALIVVGVITWRRKQKLVLPNNLPTSSLQPGVTTSISSPPTVQYLQPVNVYSTPMVATGGYIHNNTVAMPSAAYIPSTSAQAESEPPAGNVQPNAVPVAAAAAENVEPAVVGEQTKVKTVKEETVPLVDGHEDVEVVTLPKEDSTQKPVEDIFSESHAVL